MNCAKRILMLFFFMFNIYVLYAQVQWPEINRQTKPWTRWWWMGSAVNKADLSKAMNEYSRVGLGGLEIVPIYGVKGYEPQFIDYLSPDWMNILDYTLLEANKLDLGIDLANGTGWPFGGPWISDKEAAKTVRYKVYEVKGGESLKEKILYEQEGFVRTANGKQIQVSQLKEPVTINQDLQALAIDQVQYPARLTAQLVMAYDDNGKPIDITSKMDPSGKLNWIAPPGNWKVYAIFQTLHGKMVERAAPAGEGYAVDHFSSSAIQTYFEKFDKSFKGHDIRGIRAMFNDSYEVDDARGQADWTPLFLSEFQKRRGYDLSGFLPALFKDDSEDKNRRVICDYRTTISELLLENYTLAWHKWAQGKDAVIRNQSHGSPANILDLYAIADIPETEGNHILRFKFASSAAHVTGKPLVSSESATWLDEHFLTTLGDVKESIDKYFLGGVNHIFYHGVAYSPASDPWPGWLFYASVHFQPVNPFWEHFAALNSYISRCQSFLQQGLPDNDVLLYYPIYDRFSDPGNALLRHFDGMEKEFEGSGFEKSAETMLARGYAFDFISDRQLQQLRFLNEALVSGNVSYQTIVIPECTYMPFETWEYMLQNLVKEGATVIFNQKPPQKIPGLAGIKKEETLDSLLKEIQFSPLQNGIQTARYGKGRIMVGDNLDRMLTNAKVRRESLVDHQIQFTRRKINGNAMYFLVNNNKQRWEGWLPLQCKASSVVLYNAMNQQKGLAQWRRPLNETEIYLQLDPGESIIVEALPEAIVGEDFRYFHSFGEPYELKGDWNVTFANGGPAIPQPLQLNELKSWTELEGSNLKHFSGLASYKLQFTVPVPTSKFYMLNLGQVKESAEVWINNQYIATLIGNEFKTLVDASVLKETNILEVKVANTMANRIIYLEQQGINWKKFYNINFPYRLPQNKGEDGLFSAEKWEPLPSGLLGPVTLTPVE